jgi:hypothetical protein
LWTPITRPRTGSKNVLAVKVQLARSDNTAGKEQAQGIGVMLNFAHVLDRVRPQASLGVGLTFVVAWIGALSYGVLTVVW